MYLKGGGWAFCSLTGQDSGKVVIWNMAPVLKEEDEKNENIPKMLCQMDNHLGNKDYSFVLPFLSISCFTKVMPCSLVKSQYHTAVVSYFACLLI